MREEIDRDTGRPVRKMYDVGLFLNPDDLGDVQFYGQNGDIIVCYEGRGASRDLVFIGPPTPDMEPLDDEAEAITAEESRNWVHPINDLPGNGFSDNLIQDFLAKIAEVQAGAMPTRSASSVSPEAFAALQEQVQALMEQNAALQAKALEGTESRR